MSATSDSGSDVGSGAVSLVSFARCASWASSMSRLSRYLTCDLVEVLVLAHDDDRALPEVLGLVLVVAEQPLEDVVALADVGQRPRRVVRVGTDEQVDAGAPDLLPLAELVELGARRDQHLAGPVADLGEEDAGGLAVGEEDADGLAVHWC